MVLSSVLFISVILCLHSPFTIAYDIVVYGATPGGIAAAITAARVSSSLSIALLEPTADIGGMSTGGGLGLRDLGLIDTSEKVFIILFSVLFLWIS
jgi:ribulose 1,5-bisphosphate synthetase/thiazole synthase